MPKQQEWWEKALENLARAKAEEEQKAAKRAELGNYLGLSLLRLKDLVGAYNDWAMGNPAISNTFQNFETKLDIAKKHIEWAESEGLL